MFLNKSSMYPTSNTTLVTSFVVTSRGKGEIYLQIKDRGGVGPPPHIGGAHRCCPLGSTRIHRMVPRDEEPWMQGRSVNQGVTATISTGTGRLGRAFTGWNIVATPSTINQTQGRLVLTVSLQLSHNPNVTSLHLD